MFDVGRSMFDVHSFLFRLDWLIFSQRPRVYETIPCWNSEPQNIEQEISNDEGMWNGFDFYGFYLDWINRIIRNFFACGEGPFGQRPHYPDDPVDPVKLFSLKLESIPPFFV